MLYQSGQRGMLELDLLMGSWAKKHLPTLDEAGLTEFDKLLTMETPSLLKMLLNQSPDDVRT
jgi:antitoxin CptB